MAMRFAASLATVLALASSARAEPHYTSRGGFLVLGLAQTDLGYAHSSRGRGLLVEGVLATGHDHDGLDLALGLGLITMRPGGDGDDGGFANLWGADLRLRIGTSLDDRLSVGGELSDQLLDGRWRAADGAHHAFTSNLGIGPYVALELGAGLWLIADGAIRWGWLLDHTRLFGDVDDGRWHGAAELELGVGLLGLWGD
ncbi:MAG TPA: hypothetical protein VGC42_16105 [Kofleriaceae bacterium]